MAFYRFKVTNKISNNVIGTGCFSTTNNMNESEQLDFVHKYTHGMYLKNISFLVIETYEVSSLYADT